MRELFPKIADQRMMLVMFGRLPLNFARVLWQEGIEMQVMRKLYQEMVMEKAGIKGDNLVQIGGSRGRKRIGQSR